MPYPPSYLAKRTSTMPVLPIISCHDPNVRLGIVKPLNEVLNEIAQATGIDPELMRSSSRRTPQAVARKIFAFR